MKHKLRAIIDEIESLQYTAAMKNRHVEYVYLTETEMDEFADEVKAKGFEDDPRKVGAFDNFRWKGTIIARDWGTKGERHEPN
jgi:hypothetical protein